jgi:hypothetical protein
VFHPRTCLHLEGVEHLRSELLLRVHDGHVALRRLWRTAVPHDTANEPRRLQPARPRLRVSRLRRHLRYLPVPVLSVWQLGLLPDRLHRRGRFARRLHTCSAGAVVAVHGGRARLHLPGSLHHQLPLLERRVGLRGAVALSVAASRFVDGTPQASRPWTTQLGLLARARCHVSVRPLD